MENESSCFIVTLVLICCSQEAELDFDLIRKISEEEISFLTKGEDPYDDAVVRKLFHPNLKLLLVTEHADGCRYYTKKEEQLRDALKFANACGALTVMERGAIPALPLKEAFPNAMFKSVS